MAIAVQSTSTLAYGSASTSHVITKPSGLAVGDLMLAIVQTNEQADSGWNVPSGWTAELNGNAGFGLTRAVFYKIADSGDVAASNFTFGKTTSATAAGIIYRIDGHDPTDPIHATDNTDATSTTAHTISVSATPFIEDSLVITSFHNHNVNRSYSAYGSSPSYSFTEALDEGTSTDAGSIASAYAVATNTTTITDIQVTANGFASLNGVILVISPQVNASGTTALLTPDTEIFSQNGGTGGAGTAALHTPAISLFSTSGTGDDSAKWTNNTRPNLSQEELNATTMSGDNRVFMNGDNKLYRDSDARQWSNQTRP